MSEEKLKPCPFCGSEARGQYVIPQEGYSHYGCSNDRCAVFHLTMKLEKWNSRKNPSMESEEV